MALHRREGGRDSESFVIPVLFRGLLPGVFCKQKVRSRFATSSGRSGQTLQGRYNRTPHLLDMEYRQEILADDIIKHRRSALLPTLALKIVQIPRRRRKTLSLYVCCSKEQLYKDKVKLRKSNYLADTMNANWALLFDFLPKNRTARDLRALAFQYFG